LGGKERGGEAFVGKCFASRINCNRLKWPREVGGYMRDMENSPGVAKLTKAPGAGDLRASQSGSGGYHRQGFTGALGQCREGAGEGGGRRRRRRRRRRGKRGRVGVRGGARQNQQENSNRVPRPWMFASKQAGAQASKQVVPRRTESITLPLPCRPGTSPVQSHAAHTQTPGYPDRDPLSHATILRPGTLTVSSASMQRLTPGAPAVARISARVSATRRSTKGRWHVGTERKERR